MEDSEQRKKRLKEMRQQADLAQVSGGSEGSGVPGLLSNPLIEAPSTIPSRAAPRFDFYTDPMNAFSSNKRNNAGVQVAPDYFPPPSFGGAPTARFSSPHPESINLQLTPSPTQASPEPYGNPVWNGPRGPAHYNAPVWNGPRGPAHYSSNPRFEQPGSPFYNSPQGIVHHPNHSPNPSPGYRNSPNPSPGRGRGFWQNRNPVSGRGSGRGRSSQGHSSNEDRAYGQDRFYKRSMVEDPWKLLKPVIWKAPYAFPVNSKSWTSTSKSASTEQEGPTAASVKSNSEPSLAEYLAAAFNEAAAGAENNAENV
ncbi:hypothetical protein TanjilG_32510 [Lupinus angustifolius]|uniref:Hydroxyproline-rich glycoprotein family protein n=1 Tax=Lupinus angustifolius TaxID=3871 RepID=A0A4P1R7V4_LUPAN|nr:PREDICTED: uncharacterized protein LOC109357552 [Lupinus angustifolius]OIW04318.1 hypothetical protein TanjilG_32510 [Lupinus angustifolius]